MWSATSSPPATAIARERYNGIQTQLRRRSSCAPSWQQMLSSRARSSLRRLTNLLIWLTVCCCWLMCAPRTSAFPHAISTPVPLCHSFRQGSVQPALATSPLRHPSPRPLTAHCFPQVDHYLHDAAQPAHRSYPDGRVGRRGAQVRCGGSKSVNHGGLDGAPSREGRRGPRGGGAARRRATPHCFIGARPVWQQPAHIHTHVYKCAAHVWSGCIDEGA